MIPALNEALNLPHVFERLPEGLHEVLIVDGQSVDKTVEVARGLRNDVKIVHQTTKGKGHALACGFAECTGDVIVMIDADGSTDPAEIPRFIEAIAAGADYVKGSRFLPGGGSADITRTRRIGNVLLNTVVNTLYGTRFTDLCYGYNAFLTSCLDTLVVDCPGFEVETLMNVRAAKLGFTISEVPSFESLRIHGQSNLHPFRDGVRVLRTIFKERFGSAGGVPPVRLVGGPAGETGTPVPDGRPGSAPAVLELVPDTAPHTTLGGTSGSRRAREPAPASFNGTAAPITASGGALRAPVGGAPDPAASAGHELFEFRSGGTAEGRP